IPHLYEWVVTGYLASDRKDDARDAAVGAARDYLEVDALAEAERMLQVAKGIESQDAPAVVAMRTLESIIAGRREGNVNGAANWTATQLLDAAFIARQKFKLFADTAQAAGDDAVAQRYSAAALDAVAQQNFLTGVADEIRLSHVRRAIEQMVSWAPADVRRSSNARSWKVATPDNSDRTVTWPAALVIRGRSTSEGP
ncbi:MAG TPA: hypothetical protein VJ276_07325, partial [Thermoanaerobaculia bacterium]|nr:hypothetical protein [Thermoanaerobaculia bacterium]